MRRGMIFLVLIFGLTSCSWFESWDNDRKEHDRKMQTDAGYKHDYLMRVDMPYRNNHEREIKRLNEIHSQWMNNGFYAAKYTALKTKGIEERIARQQAEYYANTPYAVRVLGGSHILRRSFEVNQFSAKGSAQSSSKAHGSAGLFLLFGGGTYDSNSSGSSNYQAGDDLTLYFSWLLKGSQFVISKLPLTRVRPELSDDAEKPNIEFVWKDPPEQGTGGNNGCWTISRQDENYLLANCLDYAVIHCKPELWGFAVQLPLKKAKE